MRIAPLPSALVTACLVLWAASLARADAAAEFDQLFGAEVKRVAATPEPADDLELAKTLAKAADRSQDKPELRIELAKHAVQLAIRSPEGTEVALAATDMLGGDETAKLTTLEQIADARFKDYGSARGDDKPAAGEALLTALVDAGDEARNLGDSERASGHYRKASSIANTLRSPQRDAIKLRLDAATQDRRIDLMIDASKNRLKANGQDKAAAAELINLYLVEKDDPAEARKYTFLSDDAAINDNVKLAAGAADQLTESQMFDLGDWYRGLADSAKSPGSRLAMLRRAGGFYDQYLAVHAAEDVYRTKAVMASKKIAEELAAAGATAAAPGDNGAIKPGRWIDLLAKTDPAKHAKRGDWTRQGDTVSLKPGGMAQIMFPVVPEGSYEITVKFTRDGGTGFGIYVPVKDSGVLVVAGFEIGRQFIVHGLSRVNGKEVNDRDNPTRTDGITTDTQGAKVLSIKVRIKDDAVQIAGVLNGKTIAVYSGDIRSLQAHGIAASRNPTAPGVFSWNAGVVLADAKLKMTDGSAEWIADEQVAAVNPGDEFGNNLAEGIGDAIRRAAEGGRGRDFDRDRDRGGRGFGGVGGGGRGR